MMYFYLIVIIHIILTIIVRISTTVSKLLKDESESNISDRFSARIVGIFVADSELPYTLELAKPSIEIAIEKVI
jgi:hypothetical protein